MIASCLTLVGLIPALFLKKSGPDKVGEFNTESIA